MMTGNLLKILRFFSCGSLHTSRMSSEEPIKGYDKFSEWASVDGLIAYTVQNAGLINQLLRRISLKKQSLRK
jgi:hypothetical protein